MIQSGVLKWLEKKKNVISWYLIFPWFKSVVPIFTCLNLVLSALKYP